MYIQTGARGPKVVALGGGHGLYATLSALRHITHNITAVVTVADDGGSSGRIRHELDVLPPGDLRMALSALCDDGEWGQLWRDVLQHRFSTTGPLDGHAMGNLLIVALWEQLHNNVAGLDWVGKLLRIKGRVLPMASVPLEIEADITNDDGSESTIRGQVTVAKARGSVHRVRLVPAEPPVEDDVINAILDADFVILGPGSWYTSIIPHLMVPRLREALTQTTAKRILTINLGNDNETSGMSPADHVTSFHEHAPDLKLDVVITDPSAIESMRELTAAVRACGADLLVRAVRMDDGSSRHDYLRLASAYRDAFEGRTTSSDN